MEIKINQYIHNKEQQIFKNTYTESVEWDLKASSDGEALTLDCSRALAAERA